MRAWQQLAAQARHTVHACAYKSGSMCICTRVPRVPLCTCVYTHVQVTLADSDPQASSHSQIKVPRHPHTQIKIPRQPHTSGQVLVLGCQRVQLHHLTLFLCATARPVSPTIAFPACLTFTLGWPHQRNPVPHCRRRCHTVLPALSLLPHSWGPPSAHPGAVFHVWRHQHILVLCSTYGAISTSWCCVSRMAPSAHPGAVFHVWRHQHILVLRSTYGAISTSWCCVPRMAPCAPRHPSLTSQNVQPARRTPPAASATLTVRVRALAAPTLDPPAAPLPSQAAAE